MSRNTKIWIAVAEPKPEPLPIIINSWAHLTSTNNLRWSTHSTLVPRHGVLRLVFMRFSFADTVDCFSERDLKVQVVTLLVSFALNNNFAIQFHLKAHVSAGNTTTFHGSWAAMKGRSLKNYRWQFHQWSQWCWLLSNKNNLRQDQAKLESLEAANENAAADFIPINSSARVNSERGCHEWIENSKLSSSSQNFKSNSA